MTNAPTARLASERVILRVAAPELAAPTLGAMRDVRAECRGVARVRTCRATGLPKALRSRCPDSRRQGVKA